MYVVIQLVSGSVETSLRAVKFVITIHALCIEIIVIINMKV